jgi:hypothetical protein
MMSYANVTQLPAQRVPLVDEQMPGLVSRDWYRFFQRLFELTNAGSNATTITDLELAPTNDFSFALAEIRNTIQSLSLEPITPEPVPVSNSLRYGSFYNSANQTAAVINTAYSIAFPTVSLSKGVSQPVSNTQIAVDRAGLYLFETTLQLNLTGTNSLVSLWAAKNGTNLTNSGSQHVIMSSNIDALLLESSNISNVNEKNGISRTFMLPLAANDYLEFKWATSSTSVVLTATAASSPVPAIPSAALNVYRIGDI